jgi:hypothetical protein
VAAAFAARAAAAAEVLPFAHVDLHEHVDRMAASINTSLFTGLLARDAMPFDGA